MMIDFMNKIIQSTIDNLVDAVTFLLIIVFYEVAVLQLPIPEIFNMMGIVVLFTLGLNVILSSDNHAEAHL